MLKQRVVKNNVTLSNGIALSIRAFCRAKRSSRRIDARIIGFESVAVANITLNTESIDVRLMSFEDDEEWASDVQQLLAGLKATNEESIEIIESIAFMMDDARSQPHVI